MLTTLRRGGILRSIRGPKGGYQLMRSPSEVLVADVVNCLEGEGSTKDTPTRATAEFQVLLELDQQLEAARQALLKSTSLQDLIDRRDAQTQEQAMYFI
jgi:Rrf2 family protein